LFEYVTKPEILREFLRRFLNLKTKGCAVVGDDLTSNLGTHRDCGLVKSLARKYDPSYTYTAEKRKVIRRFILTHKQKTTYLAYKPIFVNPWLFLRALRDAIEGHRQVYLAGLVHRDINKGNVIVARKDDGPSTGFIHDVDYAFIWKRFLASKGKPVDLESWMKHARDEYVPTRERVIGYMMRMMKGGQADNGDKRSATTGETTIYYKQCTSTLHFMAVEVLSGHVIHEARHDLESFYWLLVWIVLRHTAFIHEDEERAWYELFNAGTITNCCTLKESWLKQDYPPVMVMQNMPLTTLLEDFRQLCKTNFDKEELKKQCITHEDVLEIFNKALENPGAWPQDDRAKPWTLPKSDNSDQVPGMEERSGQARTKGTLTYTSAAASRSASRLGARLQPKKRPESPPAPSTSKAEPNEEHTNTNTDTDTAESDVDESGAGPAKRTTRSRSAGKRRVAVTQHTSSTMSHASDSNEVPPSSGREQLQRHRSGYALRSVQTTKVDEVRQSARSTSRKMGPPLAPRTRSGGSQSQSASRPISAQGVASKGGSSATKRTRARGGDVEVEDDAGASHSSKRQRTLNQPETGQGSRKSRVRR